MNMVYVRKLDMQYFDYELYEDAFYDLPVFVHGNKDFGGINADTIKQILKLEDNFYELEYHYGFSNLTDYLDYYCPKKDNGKRLSPKEKHLIEVAINSYDDFRYRCDYEENLIVTLLNIIYGKRYKKVTIRGCMQCEWDYMYIPEETSQATINYLEAIYFGTGTELAIREDDEDCEQFYYTASYSDSDLITEVAQLCGVKEEEVVIEG